VFDAVTGIQSKNRALNQHPILDLRQMGNSRATAKSHCISSSVTPMQATDDAIVLVMFGLLCQHKIHPSQLKSRVRMALASNTAGLVSPPTPPNGPYFCAATHTAIYNFYFTATTR
jgi:hypothetical protein